MVDSVPAMLDQKCVLIDVFKQKTFFIILFYCMIHIENKCAQCSDNDGIESIMDTVIKTV
jgi:hypothetical protein